MTTYDVVNVGSTFDLVKNFIGKRLFAKTADYVVRQMRDAVTDQKRAIRESSDILSSHTKGTDTASDAIDSDLDPYNAGWLAGFYSGLVEAEQDAQTGIWFTGSKEDYLVKFLTKQWDAAKVVRDAHPTEFNSGVVDGYNNWIAGLRGGWVKF